MNFSKIAIKYKLKESVVKDEYERFWKQVRKELLHPKELKVVVPYFGRFVTDAKKLTREVKALEKKLSYLDTVGKTIRNENFRKEYTTQLEQVCHLLANTSTEDTEGCKICHRLLKDITT